MSPRERRVLELAAQGLTDKGIAVKLGISATTVITYWSRIRAKIGQHPRTELVAAFVRASTEADIAALKEELRKMAVREEELRRDFAKMEHILDAAPEAMLAVDPAGVVLRGNQLAAEMLACPIEKFSGVRVGKFIPEEFHDAHREYRRDLVETPRRVEVAHGQPVEILDYHGNRILGFVTVNVARYPDSTIAVVILRKARSTDDAGL
ncbi:MAG: PAS domain-containing protein [Fimbriimonadaceae bacterium]|nr:PAS domain-containing protein [Fimbriimonadaceae bacterium]QYK55525.1 MAG: PAS domain-containing protein [Fimbriimonadaceae bacterium]